LNAFPKRLKEAVNKKIDTVNTFVPKGFQETEKNLIISVLEKNNWNRTKSAKDLDINPSTLWRKMRKYKIISK
jgi:transcriptional regulator of acetoin/glycerol metabolism